MATRDTTSTSNGHEKEKQDKGSDPLAKGLGWFSVGLGLTRLLTPGGLSRLIGLEGDDKQRNTMRAFGGRELASGVGILASNKPQAALWSRVVGDVIDLAALGIALRGGNNNRNKTRIIGAMASVLGVTAADIVAATRQSRSNRAEGDLDVKKSITINRPPEAVYSVWRDFAQLPRFMAHLESITVIDARRSRWKAKGPAGTTIEWEAEITEDRPNELISWRSVEGSEVANSGTVRFLRAPGGRGTEVHVELSYDAPAGKLGKLLAKLFGEEPSQQINGDLRRFKQVLETGEVMHSDASIHRGLHPACPSEETPELLGVPVLSYPPIATRVTSQNAATEGSTFPPHIVHNQSATLSPQKTPTPLNPQSEQSAQSVQGGQSPTPPPPRQGGSKEVSR